MLYPSVPRTRRNTFLLLITHLICGALLMVSSIHRSNTYVQSSVWRRVHLKVCSNLGTVRTSSQMFVLASELSKCRLCDNPCYYKWQKPRLEPVSRELGISSLEGPWNWFSFDFSWSYTFSAINFADSCIRFLSRLWVGSPDVSSYPIH